MKTRKSNKEIVNQNDGCCGSTIETTNISDQQCCEQPADASSCCDKNAAKEINIEKTGCC